MQHFNPVAMRPLFRREAMTEGGISRHMFCRQSALFVGYLFRRDPGQFKVFLTQVAQGAGLEDAFDASFHHELLWLWQAFVTQLP